MNWYAYVENDPVQEGDALGLMSGGRGPGHRPSLKRDPRDWLERFKGRRERNRGDKPGEDEQLRNRCRELEKWLLALTMVSSSEANLHRELLNQYDWCRRRNYCKEPSLDPNPAQRSSSAPDAILNRTWINDGIPRWDDGTPLDPNKYPKAYDRSKSGPRQIYVFPINPVVPGIAPGFAPIRPLVFVN